MKKIYFLAAVFLWGINVQAFQKVEVSQVPTWSSPVRLPEKSNVKKEDVSDGFCNLLISRKVHLQSETTFFNYSRKIFTKTGIQNGSEIQVIIDPLYEKLSFHFVNIVRNGNRLDKLNPDKFSVLDEEKDRKKYLYSGNKTYLLILDDVREGDVIEYSFSITGFNPIYGDHAHQSFYLQFYDPADIIFYQLIAPAEKKLNVKLFNQAEAPKVSLQGNERVYTIEKRNVDGVKFDDLTPSWYDPYDVVSIGEWESWQEVKKWALQVFDIPYDASKIRKQAEQTVLENATKEEKVLAALKFVQNEIRYTGFEGGISGMKPHAPDIVLDNRFGDCKDKSLLLCHILKLWDVEAYPVLVNSYYNGEIDNFLPSPNAFNHAIVQINLGGKTYWVDPTATHQQGTLETITLSDFKKGLVLNRNHDEGLADIVPFQLNKVEVVEDYILSNGNDGITTFKVISKYFGSEANYQRYSFENSNLSEVQENYLNYYAKIYPKIEKDGSLYINDDTLKNVFIVEEAYLIQDFWNNEKDSNTFICNFYAVDLNDKIRKPTRRLRKMPMALPYPTDISINIFAVLPLKWQIEAQNMKIENDFFKYDKKVDYVNNVLDISYSFAYRKDVVHPDEMEGYLKDLEKLDDQTGYQLYYTLPGAPSLLFDSVMVGVILISIAIGIHYVLKINQYDPVPIYTFKPLEIGGWLVLLAINLILIPIRMIAELIQAGYFKAVTWQYVLDTSNQTFDIRISALFLGEVVTNMFFFLFSFLLIYQFFQKRTSLPRLVSIYMVSKLAFLLLDTVLLYLINGEGASNNDLSEIARTIVATAFWVAYLNISNRSKETFLLSLNKRQKEVLQNG